MLFVLIPFEKKGILGGKSEVENKESEINCQISQLLMENNEEACKHLIEQTAQKAIVTT